MDLTNQLLLLALTTIGTTLLTILTRDLYRWVKRRLQRHSASTRGT